jgi:hypothetical protein
MTVILLVGVVLGVPLGGILTLLFVRRHERVQQQAQQQRERRKPAEPRSMYQPANWKTPRNGGGPDGRGR